MMLVWGSWSHVQGLAVLARSLAGSKVPHLLNPCICMAKACGEGFKAK